MQLNDRVILGLDIGMGSLGWALIEEHPETLEKTLVQKINPNGEVQFALGARLIAVPEDPKKKELLNVHRRQMRMQRRVIRRRAQRMRALRRLLSGYGMQSVEDIATFHHQPKNEKQRNPWQLRVEGLERRLTAEEWACVLLHMAKHRGFKSNSKRDRSGTDAETGKVLSAVEGLQKNMAASAARTVGELFAALPRKRNRKDSMGNANYSMTILRILLEEETDLLFAKQKEMGNPHTPQELRIAYKKLAFEQRPLQSVAGLIGPCAFMPHEKRAPRFAPTAELFRLVQRLGVLRLRTEAGERRSLTKEEIQRIAAECGKQKKLTYKTLRKILGLDPALTFDGLAYGKQKENGKEEDPERNDFVAKSGSACLGSYTLREVLGEQSALRLGTLRAGQGEHGRTPLYCTDVLIKIISENDDIKIIEDKFSALPLKQEEQEKLLGAVKAGTFAFCRGTMNIGLRAMEAILPHMLEGANYAEACELAGFNHAQERLVDINDIRNPVVQHLLREVRRQCRTVMHEFGVIPGRVHIELLRDVGKSAEERRAIEKGQEQRRRERADARQYLAKEWDTSPEQVSSTEVQRYDLWKEQGEQCAYHELWKHAGATVYSGEFTEGRIPLHWLRDSANTTQIDHILPRSRTFDNSFHNLCLCCTSANQAKGNNTPFEWLGQKNPEAWHKWSVWVKGLRDNGRGFKGLKRRNYLLENLDAEMEGRFHARNLTDSSYVARLVARWFRQEYAHMDIAVEEEGAQPRRVFTRPGSVTDFLRKLWGVQGLKKDKTGERIGDRHHALDALVVACCSEGMLQRITRVFQMQETQYERPHMPPPWPTFREDMPGILDTVFISRAVQSKTTGALHKATLRAIRTEKDEDGKDVKILYERTFVGEKSFTLESLGRIKDPHRCTDVIAALTRWIDQGKPQNSPPKLPSGDIIRHVRLRAKDAGGRFSSGVELRRGSGIAQADNGDWARVDVYTKNGKFYLVPVYIKDVAEGRLPVRAIVAHKAEAQWTLMDASYAFHFSLTKDCFVVTKGKKKDCEGYYTGADRTTAAISLSMAHDRQEQVQRIYVQNLLVFQKYQIDRLGRRHRVTSEPDPRCTHELEGNTHK